MQNELVSLETVVSTKITFCIDKQPLFKNWNLPIEYPNSIFKGLYLTTYRRLELDKRRRSYTFLEEVRKSLDLLGRKHNYTDPILLSETTETFL